MAVKGENVNSTIGAGSVFEGKFYIVQTELYGKTFLRTVIMNPFTTSVEMNSLLKYLKELTNHVDNE